MSELHRFSIDETAGDPDAAWKRGVETFLRALLNNPDILISDSNSRIIHPAAGVSKRGGSTSVVAAGGAFYSLYLDGDGDTYLQGGSVVGSNGNASGVGDVADEKVIDAGTGPVHTSAYRLYLVCNVTATVANGLLLPGTKLNTVSLTAAAAAPDQHTFTAASETGDIFEEIGRWTDTGFLPSAAGNRHTTPCVGDFRVTA